LRKQNAGAVIYFIGIDGSGKTTHALSLSKALVTRGVKCIYVRPRYELLRFFPSGLRNWVNRHIHVRPASVSFIKRSSGNRKSSVLLRVTLSFLFLIYAFTTYWLTIKLYSRKFYVICDRYFFDWFHDEHKLCSLTVARLLPMPDLGFLLDIPVALAFSRMSSCEDARISFDYYKSLREWYIALAKLQGFMIIDSSSDFERTKDLIFKRVMLHLEVDSKIAVEQHK